MATSGFVSKASRRPRILSVVAALLLAGSVGCAGYSLSRFHGAHGLRSELESRMMARQQPDGRDAAGLEMMVGLFAGVGPMGVDIAVMASIFEREKDAWKFLCFALILGAGGFHLFRYSLRDRSPVPPPVAEGGGPPAPITKQPGSFGLDPDA